MKRMHIFYAVTLSLVLSALFATGTESQAQDRLSARTVAARVQSFYDQTRTFKSIFYQNYYHRLYGRYEHSRGTLAFAKPGRMRFDYARPNGKKIVANGRTLTMWEPGDDGGPGQYLQSEMGESALPGAFSFLTGTTRLEQDYTFRLLSSSRYRWNGHVLELRPRGRDPRYKRIILYVDAHPTRRGVVHKIRIDDHEGNRNRFTLRHMRFNRSLPARHFAFLPPEGALRIRM